MGHLDGYVTILARLAGAALLAAMAGIHLDLWIDGYRFVDTIGPLFLINGVLGGLAAVVVALVPRRWLGLAAAASSVLEAGTLAGLVLSLTVGLFGFVESTQAELVVTTLWVESAGVVVLGAVAVRELLRRRRRQSTPLPANRPANRPTP